MLIANRKTLTEKFRYVFYDTFNKYGIFFINDKFLYFSIKYSIVIQRFFVIKISFTWITFINELFSLKTILWNWMIREKTIAVLHSIFDKTSIL